MGCAIANHMPACLTLGSTGEGQTCTGSTACQAGLLCVGGGTAGICDKFCDTDMDCGASEICGLQLSDGSGGSIPNAELCSNTCDLTTDSGCPSGTECQLGQEASGMMRFFTYCSSTGTGVSNSPCTEADSCAPTYGCFTSAGSMVCLQYCYVSNFNACGGLVCSPLTTSSMTNIIVNGQEIGVCP